MDTVDELLRRIELKCQEIELREALLNPEHDGASQVACEILGMIDDYRKGD